jgi:hypothetical protein
MMARWPILRIGSPKVMPVGLLDHKAVTPLEPVPGATVAKIT